MIDYIKGSTLISPAHAKMLLGMYKPKQRIKNIDKDNTIEFKVKGMRYEMGITELIDGFRLNLSNSVTKYALEGCNYNNPTASQIKTAINDICNDVFINPEEVTLSKCEYGINVPQTKLLDVTGFMSNTFGYKSRELQAYKEREVLVKKLQMTDYDIKFYNKTNQVLKETGNYINKKILRIEMMTKKKGAIVNYLSDLTKKCITDDLHEKLIYFAKYLRSFKPIPDISTRDFEFLLAGTKDVYWEQIKTYMPESLRKDKKRFSRLTKKYASCHEINNHLIEYLDKEYENYLKY